MRDAERDEDGLFYVYAVELAPSSSRGLRAPGAPSRGLRAPGAPSRFRAQVPSVYVGSSALRPEDRFQRHKDGDVSSSRHVRRRGIRLLPDLYARMNPLPSRDAAHRAERALRRELTRRGYRVYGSCDARKDGCFF